MCDRPLFGDGIRNNGSGEAQLSHRVRPKGDARRYPGETCLLTSAVLLPPISTVGNHFSARVGVGADAREELSEG